jgi:hypothetical protein
MYRAVDEPIDKSRLKVGLPVKCEHEDRAWVENGVVLGEVILLRFLCFDQIALVTEIVQKQDGALDLVQWIPFCRDEPSYDPNELPEDPLDSVLFDIESGIKEANRSIEARVFWPAIFGLVKALRAASCGAEKTGANPSVAKLLDSELITKSYREQLIELISRCVEELKCEG